MEEPSTPSSEMWWRLMGDDPISSPRGQRTPITPRTFASLWGTPATIPERENENDDDNQTARGSKKSTGSKQPRQSTDENVRVSGSDSLLDEASNKDKNNTDPVSQRHQEKVEVKSGNQASDERIRVNRITVEHRGRKIPSSPLSGRDDAFEDHAGYSEGTTEKFLDILEDGICSPSTPSICEIEKRIEESWKEIESKR